MGLLIIYSQLRIMDQEMLEGFFWILYLGKPTKWKSDKKPEHEFEKID